MCNCKSYNQPKVNQTVEEVVLNLPINIAEYKQNRFVCVDSCIANTIKHLWANDIQTLSCCCGHNKEGPDLVVEQGYDPDEIENIRRLISEVDDRVWTIYQWQLVEVN